jgi:mono/diheme cytochrome c family protein
LTQINVSADRQSHTEGASTREPPVKRLAAMLTVLALAGCETPEIASDVQDLQAQQPSPRAAPFPEPGDASAGLAFAKKNCSTCHAVTATGASPYAPAPPLRTIHEKYDVEGLAEAFAEGILVAHKGQRQMPEFVLTPHEIDDLLAYLKSFEQNQ